MPAAGETIKAYVEMTQKRAIAVALDWPGWFRGGPDEAAALQAFAAYAPRYASIVKPTKLGFPAEVDAAQIAVVERVPGNSGTDYGVPAIALAQDAEPVDEAELDRSITLLRACWRAFDTTIANAVGKELRKGPRGGGRELEAIVRHVLESEAGYAGRISVTLKPGALEGLADLKRALGEGHDRIVDGLMAVAPLGIPPAGPRGGARWPARYFVRRTAYHVTDHIWEIEDRLLPAG